jgi:DNA-binding NarL/FixJ family response regulator
VDVLVVDDATAIRTRLRTMFADVPGVASVREAGSLAEARRLLEQKTPAVLVLDLHLCAENGLELLRDLKTARPEVLVIVLTNAATDHHRRSCEELGADYFFDKSRQFEAVLRVLEREVQRHAP